MYEGLSPGTRIHGAHLRSEALERGGPQKKRKTEVDYISGAVVRAAARQGRRAPAQEMMVNLVHAME